MSNESKRSPVGFVVAVLVVTGIGWLILRSLGAGTDHPQGASSGSAATTASTESTAAPPDPTSQANPSTDPSAGQGTAANVPAPTGAATGSADPPVITTGAPVNMGTVLLETKKVEFARAALEANDPKRALKELEEYDRIPGAFVLKSEAKVLKIEALAKVGRKTDATALAMSARDDPDFQKQLPRVEELRDAGIL